MDEILLQFILIPDLVNIINDYVTVYSFKVDVEYLNKHFYYIFGYNREKNIRIYYKDIDNIQVNVVQQILIPTYIQEIYFQHFEYHDFGPMTCDDSATLMGNCLFEDKEYYFYCDIEDFAMGDTSYLRLKLFVTRELQTLLRHSKMTKQFQQTQLKLKNKVKQSMEVDPDCAGYYYSSSSDSSDEDM